MNSQERVQRAINFQTPDRVPVSHGVLPAAQLQYGPALDAILAEFRDDFGWDQLRNFTLDELPGHYRPGAWTDEFGTGWKNETPGIKGIPAAYPLADWAAYESYRWPPFALDQQIGRVHNAHLPGDGSGRWYARGGGLIFFERMQQLRGMEALLMDIALDAPEFRRLLDDLLALYLDWLDAILKHPFDGVTFGDDWGGQRRLLIKPAAWRAIFKPAYAAMFGKVKAAGLNVHLHSDGMILDIIPDLLDLGVDVLNCQMMVIGLDNLREFAGAVCFRTDLDRQFILPAGSPAQVKEHVHETFETLGAPGGGLIAFGEVSPDVPLANVRAMYEAFRDYGQYAL